MATLTVEHRQAFRVVASAWTVDEKEMTRAELAALRSYVADWLAEIEQEIARRADDAA